jgi:hypothetical protein
VARNCGSDQPPAPVAPSAETPGLDRIKFFSDAVFAIAITLLILNVALPTGTVRSNLAHELNAIWPEYGAFAFTFLLIGLRWMTHLIQFRYIRDYDYTLLGLNLALLFVVVFLPFASRVLADYPRLPHRWSRSGSPWRPGAAVTGSDRYRSSRTGASRLRPARRRA